ncbi:MAG: DoxX family membrane protein [Ardenticatenales bacterium]|nr:DoxX family membrane protein [Ardenticatenales bacterium]
MQSFLSRPHREIQDPPIAKLLFSDTRAAWLWLIVRLYLGYQWVEAGWHKVTDAAWGYGAGEALKGYWTRAIAIPEEGRPAISFDWYRDFLTSLLNSEAYTWMAPIIAYGELLVGIGLIIGAFVGVAAFFGAFMNWNFLMAGSASTNGMLLVIAVLLILAWKVAGYIGLDYYLLPKVGTPWKSMEVNPTPIIRPGGAMV